jgi:hypothetical protein
MLRLDPVEYRLLTGIRAALANDDKLDEIERRVRTVLAAGR